VEVLRLHYAETLRIWRKRFLAHRDEAQALYDDRFCRMWEYYLSAAEVAFRCEDLVVFQIQLARSNQALPTTRDYMRVDHPPAADRFPAMTEPLGGAA
jgi:cyclopropane-fatty-acyl-phospholipid synthase